MEPVFPRARAWHTLKSATVKMHMQGKGKVEVKSYRRRFIGTFAVVNPLFLHGRKDTRILEYMVRSPGFLGDRGGCLSAKGLVWNISFTLLASLDANCEVKWDHGLVSITPFALSWIVGEWARIRRVWSLTSSVEDEVLEEKEEKTKRCM